MIRNELFEFNIKFEYKIKFIRFKNLKNKNRMLGHPCSASAHPQPQLLPSVYQAALNHAGPYGHGRAISHTPWEAVTFVAVSAVI